MAVLVLTNAYVTVGGSVISDTANSVTLNYEYDAVETTAFGDSGHKSIAGLQNNSVEVTLMQDFAATKAESIVYPLVGTTTTVVVKPNGSVTSTTNPAYTITNAFLNAHTPVAGAVGELATTTLTFSGGSIAKATS